MAATSLFLQNWEWIGSYYALTAFATASIVEVLSYYVPWVDNLMDTVATPAAITAGNDCHGLSSQ